MRILRPIQWMKKNSLLSKFIFIICIYSLMFEWECEAQGIELGKKIEKYPGSCDETPLIVQPKLVAPIQILSVQQIQEQTIKFEQRTDHKITR